jgi:hypothetical protein
MDGVALKPLTVDFHEPGFVGQLSGENGQSFWFQMNDEQRQKAGSPWGPMNPQALNRYSYVQNNPIRYVDPTGHFGDTVHDDGSVTFHLTHEEASFLFDLSVATELTLAGMVLWAAEQFGSKAAANLLAILGEAAPPIGIVGVALAVADAWYGGNGVDITIGNKYGMLSVSVGAPTKSRQHGEFYDPGVKKALDLIRGNGTTPVRSAGPDVPEGKQYCNYGYSNENGPVMGPC